MILRFSPIKERHFIDVFQCPPGRLVNAASGEQHGGRQHGGRKGVSPLRVQRAIGQGSLAKDAGGEGI